MVHKPNPVTKMQRTAAQGFKKDQNQRRYGSPYAPGELWRSLIALAIMLVVCGVVALIVLIR